jgi:hypothetical protein
VDSLEIFFKLTLLALLTSCGENIPLGGEEEADLSNPKTHRSGELSFAYPGNWEIGVDQVTTSFHNLFINTPGTAIVILQTYPIEFADDLKTFAGEFSESGAAFTSALGSVKNSVLTELPSKGGYAWLREDFEMEVALLPISVPHRRLYASKDVGDRRIFLILQVAEEDYPKVGKGFGLIGDSLTSESMPNKAE